MIGNKIINKIEILNLGGWLIKIKGETIQLDG